MKKLLLILLVALIGIPVFSQIKFGIKGGVSTTTVPSYTASGAANISALKNAAWGYHAGIFLRFELGPVFLQPEAYFASTTYQYNYYATTASLAELKKQNFNIIEVPVLVGLKLGPLRLDAGPSATVPIGKPANIINDPAFSNLYAGTTFGYQAGIGLDILNFLTLDARYGGSLAKKYGSNVNVGGTNFKLDQRQPSLILSLGIMF